MKEKQLLICRIVNLNKPIYPLFYPCSERLNEELDRLEDGEAHIEEKLQNGLLKSRKDFNFATYALAWLEKGTSAEKREVLRTTCYNLYLNNKILHISLKKPFQILEDYHNDITSESDMLEPLNNGSITRKTGDFSPVFPSLLRAKEMIGNKYSKKSSYYGS